jgi:anti-anti-sigma regulatory factor
VPAGATTEPESDDEAEEDDGCALEGVITSATENAFATIKAHAAHASEIVVDVSRLTRMDFVAATNLMNLIGTLAGTQKRVRLIHARQLVTALWEVIGLDSVARIEMRKA